jgi:hypothetical protein
LNRFLAEDFVFILGILLLLLCPGCAYLKSAPRRPGLPVMQKCGGFVVELQVATNHSASILNCHGMPCRSVRTRAYNRSPVKVQRAPSGNL